MIPGRAGNSTLLRALFASGRNHDALLQHSLEQMPEAALFVAPRTGAVIAVNSRAAALTGWSREELLSRSLAEVVAAPEAEAALAQIHALRPSQTRQLRAVPIRTRSGKSVLLDLRLSSLEAAPNGETLVLVLASSTDERLQSTRETTLRAQSLDSLDELLKLLADPAEESLGTAIELVRAMLGADAAGLYQVTPHHPSLQLWAGEAGPRGFPPSLGPSEAQYVRAPFQWTLNQRPQGFLQQAARGSGWAALLSQPVGGGPSLVGTLCVAYKPGNNPPQLAQNLLAIAAVYVHQLTTQISTQAAHARARDLAVRLNGRLAAVNAQIEEAVLLLTAAGTLEEINGAAARMFGYRSEEVTGLQYEDVLIGGDPRLARDVRACLDVLSGDTAGQNFDSECNLLRRSGEAFPASVRGRALPEGGCMVTLVDLSEVRATALQREHLDQLVFVGQGTQAFAHEVRGPLNNIGVGVQFLATRISADGPLAEKLALIQTECARLSSLMNQMLTWAKPLNPRLEPTSLDDLFQHLLRRFSTKIERCNVRLNYTVEPDCPRAVADARLIEQVFQNLVDNALQAMPAGGHLSISIGPGSRGSSGNVVEARVIDSGPGISDDLRRRVFDPYLTTKPDGTGLGLAICKRLVTIQHGAIGVESYPGSGTIFKVTLPAYAGPADEMDKA
jgi:PAS domain S-box-containing protein